MPVPPASPAPEGGPYHQLYVTHCLHGEGVFREAGFTVRASSTTEPIPLRFAAEYPRYELPEGFDPTSTAAPVRLALVRIPGGAQALLHTVALPPDKQGRANNFFSHVLLAPSLSPGAALSTWGSAGWVRSCPPGTGRELPLLPTLPEPGPLSDEVVTALLQGDELPEDLAPALKRMAGDGLRCARFLAQLIRGWLLVQQEPPAAPRGRLYVLAEPALTALLLHAATRLLPTALQAGLTFSTYEKLRRGPHALPPARVVGTWRARAGDGLDEECFTTRGYALDTFSDRCSPEMEKDGDAPVGPWVELAARGEWQGIDQVHGLLGSSARTVVPVRETVQVARLAGRVLAGKAEPADLLALKESRLGPAWLAEHRDSVWPLLRAASQDRALPAEAFADLLVAHIPDLKEQLRLALHTEPTGDWQAPLRLLATALRNDPRQLRDTLAELLPPPACPPAVRLALLRELPAEVANARTVLHPLLRRCTAAEVELLAGADLPREWLVWALCYALVQPGTEQVAAQQLLHGPDELVAGFWEQLGLVREEGQRRAILTPLLAPGAEGRGTLFLSRTLPCEVAIPAGTLSWALETAGVWQRSRADFWLQHDHLDHLLQRLRALGAAAESLWARLVGLLDARFLVQGDPFQKTVLAHLASARNRPGFVLGPHLLQAIADWLTLRDHFEAACALPGPQREPVLDACKRLALDPLPPLRAYFERHVAPQEPATELLDDFAGFFESFYPEGEQHHDHSCRLLGWLEVVRGCRDESLLSTYQGFFIKNRIPEELRWRLAQEAHQAGKLADATLASLPRPGEPGPAALAEPPPPPSALAPVEVAPALPPLHIEPLFQATGVRPAAGPARTLARGWSALLPLLMGGILAAVLCTLRPLPPRQAPLLLPFLPLVLLLADGAALLAVAAVSCSQPVLPSRRWREAVACLLVAAGAAGVGGLLAGGFAFAQGSSTSLAAWLGCAVGGGMVGGVLAGLAIPSLLARLRGRIPAGPVARLVAVLAATGLFLTLAPRFLR